MSKNVSFKGDPEKICKAEAEVSAKLRQAYESDLNSMPTQNVMFPGLHHPAAAASMVSPMGMGLAFNHGGVPVQPQMRLAGPASAFMGNYYNQSYNNGGQMNKPAPNPSVAAAAAAVANSNSSNHAVQGYGIVSPQDPSMASSVSALPQETTHMYIPNASVGAVIGAKGSYIRDLNKYSGYSIKIASATDDTNGYPSAVNSSDRRVTIVGPPDRFWAVSLKISQDFERLVEMQRFCLYFSWNLFTFIGKFVRIFRDLFYFLPMFRENLFTFFVIILFTFFCVNLFTFFVKNCFIFYENLFTFLS